MFKNPIKAIKIFFLSFSLIFICTFLQNSKLVNIHIADPKKVTQDSFEKIRKMLSKKQNHFSLKEPGGFPPPAYASDSSIDARAYLVVDLDSGKIIDEKNPGEKLPIASLTKIMSATVALDLLNPGDLITISNKASGEEPTKIGVVPGQKMKLVELLEASLMTSANDATQAIADGVDQKYGPGTFVRAMNEKAQILGLQSSSFSNPQGFDNSSNYSTAKDLAVLSKYALDNYVFFHEIVKQPYLFLKQDTNHKQFDLLNWNGLLGVYPGISGIKIGNTDDAGTTMVAVSQREGKKVMVVLLGSSGILERDLGAATLLDNAFETEADLPRVNLTTDDLQAKYDSWY